VEKKDPAAMEYIGYLYREGELGLKKDMSRAIELWTEAAKLGSAGACYKLGMAYVDGVGVGKDLEGAVRYYEKGAMLGHAGARHNLGWHEYKRGNSDRALRHYLISAKMGVEASLVNIKKLLKDGIATKSQYGDALKGYQDALEEMKSPEREYAKTVFDRLGSNR